MKAIVVTRDWELKNKQVLQFSTLRNARLFVKLHQYDYGLIVMFKENHPQYKENGGQ